MNPALRLVVVFLLLLPALCFGSAVERKKKVLVLHSYHQGLEWTDNITKGIRNVFDPLHKSYEVHYEYLDTKRNADTQYMDEVSRFISEKNKIIQYEVVIASDNNALRLLNEGKVTFTNNPPVIFCGINNYKKDLTKNLSKATGVAEVTDHKGTIDLFARLHPNRNNVHIVLDRTVTGNAIREEFRAIEEMYRGKLNFTYLRDFSLDDIPAQAANFGDNDIIYILTFNRDNGGNFISYSEGIEMFSRSSHVPIYGSWDFYLGKGIVGGRITSGYRQGEEAAKFAVKVLQGYEADKIDVVSDSASQYMFDYRMLQKFNINQSMLPNERVIINAPPTSYERYRPFLLGITASSLAVVIFLSWKYVRQKSLLEEKNALAIELEIKVSERTHELEKINNELRRLSKLDGLTQLHNRRYFDENLSKELKRMQRTSSPVSLLICDIDFFKNYNDTYGHLAGDDCIKMVANTIQQNCKRVSDVAARYGGEEFGVILPNTTSEVAVKIAESIRKGVESLNIAHETSEVKMIVSISIGVASIVPDMNTTPSALIAIADKALYASKHNGRDQVSLLMSL